MVVSGIIGWYCILVECLWMHCWFVHNYAHQHEQCSTTCGKACLIMQRMDVWLLFGVLDGCDHCLAAWQIYYTKEGLSFKMVPPTD